VGSRSAFLQRPRLLRRSSWLRLPRFHSIRWLSLSLSLSLSLILIPAVHPGSALRGVRAIATNVRRIQLVRGSARQNGPIGEVVSEWTIVFARGGSGIMREKARE